MKTVSVKLVPLGKVIQTREGTPLIDILHEYGVEFPCGGKGSCGKCRVKVLEGEIDTNSQHLDKLRALDLGDDWRLACLSKCSEDLVLEVGQYNTLIKADETSFDFIPGEGLGIAIDLGTTTLVGQLLDLSTGKILAVETALNPQKKFGSDLISRLESALDGQRKEMTSLIRQKIGQMIEAMLTEHAGQVQKILLVGNTVMQHFFCDFEIESLSFYPFESDKLGMKYFKAGELDWVPETKRICFYPSIGSFVGSDILAGIMATGMHQREAYTVLIDLGTNGELVIGNRDRIVCASTAAGPAFEGAKISMGMLATTGAIASVRVAEGDWKYDVIGNVEPVGICGSGLFDVIALLLENGVLGQFGEILSGESEVKLAGQVVLTQKDIQEIQLAKAAISTGLELLLRKLNLGIDDINRVYLAGGFGSYINLENVKKTGMLLCDIDRMSQLGNSALIGAKMFLFEDASVADSILSVTTHVNLESEPGFQDMFVDNLAFPI
ncbi:MAG: ASKHA domain-containing protein [Bacteroidota bacterium]